MAQTPFIFLGAKQKTLCDMHITGMMQQLQQNPDLTRQLLQNLLLGAAQAQGSLQCAYLTASLGQGSVI